MTWQKIGEILIPNDFTLFDEMGGGGSVYWQNPGEAISTVKLNCFKIYSASYSLIS